MTEEVFTEFQQLKVNEATEEEPVPSKRMSETEMQMPDLSSQMLRDALKSETPVRKTEQSAVDESPPMTAEFEAP